jgi:hypothetical protein
MRRSRTYADTPAAPFHAATSGSPEPQWGVDDHHHHHHNDHHRIETHREQSSSLLHGLASFLSMSDVAVATSPADSWAVGVEWEGSFSASGWSIPTPLTPALVALSPGATPQLLTGGGLLDRSSFCGSDEDGKEEDAYMQKVLNERRRKWAAEKITSAVFSHPRSLRSFCWEAFRAARDIRTMQQQQQEEELLYIAANVVDDDDPETLVEPPKRQRKRRRSEQHRLIPRFHIGRFLSSIIFHNIPLSVTLNLLEALGGTTLDTGGATLTITVACVQFTASTTGRAARILFDTVTQVFTNPFQILEAIVSLQFNAMGKTSEVLVSGIQSVATGMGSASSSALYRLSATVQKSSSNTALSSGQYGSHHHHLRKNTNSNLPGEIIQKNAVLNQKLLQKLAVINDAALVVDYREWEDENNGLTRRALSRTRRMMHYSVSLRSFVATVAVPNTVPQNNDMMGADGTVTPPMAISQSQRRETSASSPASSETTADDYSPFMCTPQSFPPTPHSRQVVIDQRSQLSDDVVFLARDRLRVHDGLASADERTRARSMALENGKRLAIFASDDLGIELSCGRHIATKVGNMYYASAKSMVPVLRNCYVYTEFTVLPRPGIPLKAAVASLTIGVSTQEMPPNTLVGAWQGSVGLSTTGQILLAGQWCSPVDPAMCAFGVGATVGCLVYLDDDSAFETWEGRMVKSAITFNVNGAVVSPPAPSSFSTTAVPSMIPGRHGNFFGAPSMDHRISPIQHPGLSVMPTATLTLLVPSAEDLYPTVTMQSSATSVVSRFSSEDIVAQKREQIGAPPEVNIYAIDGSIVTLEEDFMSNDDPDR